MNYFTIHEAIENNNLKQLQLSLEKGEDVNSKNAIYHTPLHVACMIKCDKEIVECLLKHNADVNAKAIYNITPLHFAILPELYDANMKRSSADYLYYHGLQQDILNKKTSSNLEIIKLLIKYGADVNAITYFFDTPLLLASEILNNLEVLKLLLKSGAKVNVKNQFDSTPLLIAMMIESLLEESNWVKILNLFIKYGAHVNAKNQSDDTPLTFVMEINKSFETMKWLIKCGGDVNTTNRQRESFLHLAVRHKSLEEIEYLINHGTNINAIDRNSITPFLLAVKLGRNIEMLRFLFEKGANISAKDKKKCTSLHYAIRGENNVDILKFLIDNGVDINVKNILEQTPLMYALDQGAMSLVNLEYLFERKADLHVKDYTGSNSLHVAAKNVSNDKKIIKFFIDHGIDVNARSNNQETPLHMAAFSNQIEILNILIENNADINAKNYLNYTPLHSALDGENGINICNLLLEKGSIIDASFVSTLTEMFDRDNEYIEEILESILTDLFKMKTLKLISDELFSKWQPVINLRLESWREFDQKCKAEISEMQHEFICSDRFITIEKILTKKLRAVATYLQVSEVKEKLSNYYSYSDKHPIFREHVQDKINKGMRLADLLNESFIILKGFLELPDIILLKILDELDQKDLENLFLL